MDVVNVLCINKTVCTNLIHYCLLIHILVLLYSMYELFVVFWNIKTKDRS